MDKKNTFELITYILYAINLIEKRFESIAVSSSFLENDEGLEKLDAISMRLQTIGEALKNILKTDIEMLTKIAPIEYWSTIIKFREIVSHHYIDIDSEIVYEVCHDELKELKQKIEKILNELQ